jgi:hypothetical protein
MASKRVGAKGCEKAEINDDMKNKRKDHLRKERMANFFRKLNVLFLNLQVTLPLKVLRLAGCLIRLENWRLVFLTGSLQG